jgi:hypothetical protein
MSHSIRIDYDVPIVMRDGVAVRADVYRPADTDKHPAILFRSYNKALFGRRLLLLYDLVGAGYAFVNSDLRGRGGSEGEWKPEQNFVVEGPDGYDSVEWIASQTWCDGNVGMLGASHAAAFQWLTAIEQPPHLKAIAPWTGDFNEMFVPALTGGAIAFITLLTWLLRESADTVNRLERQGQDVSEMRRSLAWAQANPAAVYNYLPLNDLPLARVGRLRELLQWRLHPISQPALERHRQYERVTVPCFHECGWYDGCGWAVFENFGQMRKRGGASLAREGQHLIVGPWPHAMQFQATVGDINYGFTADSVGSQIHSLQIAFFDKYLLGKDATLPTVRYFVMGRNRWQTAETWPLPQTEWQRFYLHSGGNANTAAGDGVLSRDEPQDEPPDVFIYNPHRPVPTLGGPLIGALDYPGCIAGPVEQTHVEQRHDVLCYTTPELAADVEVTGPLQAHLFAATSARDTDFTAKLAQVYPDGRAYNLAEGLMRASGRTFSEQPQPINPHEVYEYVITLGHTSQLFRKGQRIRLDVSSSNFPQFDRNLNTGHPIGKDAAGVPALQTIYHQVGCASYIDLPVIPPRS